MATIETKDLRKALRILTEGKKMKGASEFMLEAAAAHEEALPWTAGDNIQGLGIAERAASALVVSKILGVALAQAAGKEFAPVADLVAECRRRQQPVVAPGQMRPAGKFGGNSGTPYSIGKFGDTLLN